MHSRQNLIWIHFPTIWLLKIGLATGSWRFNNFKWSGDTYVWMCTLERWMLFCLSYQCIFALNSQRKIVYKQILHILLHYLPSLYIETEIKKQLAGKRWKKEKNVQLSVCLVNGSDCLWSHSDTVKHPSQGITNKYNTCTCVSDIQSIHI